MKAMLCSRTQRISLVGESSHLQVEGTAAPQVAARSMCGWKHLRGNTRTWNPALQTKASEATASFTGRFTSCRESHVPFLKDVTTLTLY